MNSFLTCWIMAILVSFASCNGSCHREEVESTPSNSEIMENTKPIVHAIRILSPSKKDFINNSQEIEIKWKVSDKVVPDSTQISIGGTTIVTINDSDVYSYLYKPKCKKTGLMSVRVTAFFSDGTTNSSTAMYNVVSDVAPKKISYDIVKIHPHDKSMFTQGLFFSDGYLYEGSGRYGRSTLAKTEVSSGKSLGSANLSSQYFGEGVCKLGNKIYQLTWKEGRCFIYDAASLNNIGYFTYDTEGWGLTSMNNNLVMSNGSNILFVRDSLNFTTQSLIEVYDDKGKLSNINELEYAKGLIWANVWMTNTIVGIEPSTGVVKYSVDCSNLTARADIDNINDSDEVLNGIAYNPNNDHFYLTGKCWGKVFEIKMKL